MMIFCTLSTTREWGQSADYRGFQVPENRETRPNLSRLGQTEILMSKIDFWW